MHLRSAVDGTAAVDGASLPTRKVMRHMGAAREMEIEAGSARQGADGIRRPALGAVRRERLAGALRRAARAARAARAGDCRGPGGGHRCRCCSATRSCCSTWTSPRRCSRCALEGRAARSRRATCVLDAGGRRERERSAPITRTLDRLAPGTWSAQLEPGALRAGRKRRQGVPGFGGRHTAAAGLSGGAAAANARPRVGHGRHGSGRFDRRGCPAPERARALPLDRSRRVDHRAARGRTAAAVASDRDRRTAAVRGARAARGE